MKTRATVWLACVVALVLASVLAPARAWGATSEGARSKVNRFSDVPVCSTLNEDSGAASYPFMFMLDLRVVDSKDPSVRSAVGAVQRLLRRIRYTGTSGALLTVDGTFGAQTAHAVRAFQRDYGLKIDGKVGPQTWTTLAREACDYSWARDPGKATMSAVLTKTEAQRALDQRLRGGNVVPPFTGCFIEEGPMAQFCSRAWRLPSGGHVHTGVTYANTAKEAMSLFPVWSLPD